MTARGTGSTHAGAAARVCRPSCNVSNPNNPPRLPAGFEMDESVDDE
jgi:hypothetical protein